MSALYLDCETTGLDPWTDRIVELCLIAEGGEPLVSRVNPGVPISAEASEVHGITDADVATVPSFRELAPAVQRLVDTADVLVSFNGRCFDTLFLDAELRRAEQPGIDLDGVQEIDLYRVWLEMEPRSLAGAVMRFLGREHEEAHGAEPDCRVLEDLAGAMAMNFGISGEEMCRLSRPEHEVDRSGRLRMDPEKGVVFAFGKHDGKPVLDHPDYCRWMREKGFPRDTMEALERAYRAAREPAHA